MVSKVLVPIVICISAFDMWQMMFRGLPMCLTGIVQLCDLVYKSACGPIS